MDLRNKTTSELRTVFHNPLGVPNSHVPLYFIKYTGRYMYMQWMSQFITLELRPPQD